MGEDRYGFFNLHLMSNARCKGATSDNKPGHFRNILSSNIDLNNGDWCVALGNIRYEHTWQTMDHKEMCSFLIVREDDKGEYPQKGVPGIDDIIVPIPGAEPLNMHHNPYPASADRVDVELPPGI